MIEKSIKLNFKNAKDADVVNAYHCGLDYESYQQMLIET